MNEITAGRDQGCELVVNDEYASRHHCRFTLNGDYLVVTDLSSANGTFLDGQRLKPLEPATIQPGSHLTIGPNYTVDLGAVVRQIREAGPASAAGAATGRPRRAPGAQATPPARPQPTGPAGPPPQTASQPQQASLPSNRGAKPVDVSDIAYAFEAQKSYVGKAWAALLLYPLGYLPGFIMNLIWMSEAKRTKAVTGGAPGYGCLVFLIFVNFVIPVVITLVLWILITIGAVAEWPF